MDLIEGGEGGDRGGWGGEGVEGVGWDETERIAEQGEARGGAVPMEPAAAAGGLDGGGAENLERQPEADNENESGDNEGGANATFLVNGAI